MSRQFQKILNYIVLDQFIFLKAQSTAVSINDLKSTVVIIEVNEIHLFVARLKSMISSFLSVINAFLLLQYLKLMLNIN